MIGKIPHEMLELQVGKVSEWGDEPGFVDLKMDTDITIYSGFKVWDNLNSTQPYFEADGTPFVIYWYDGASLLSACTLAILGLKLLLI